MAKKTYDAMLVHRNLAQLYYGYAMMEQAYREYENAYEFSTDAENLGINKLGIILSAYGCRKKQAMPEVKLEHQSTLKPLLNFLQAYCS